MEDQSNGKICFADFEIDTAHRRLFRDGEIIAINAKAFDVLEFLARNAGRVVTKDEILDSVWENQFVEEANLKVQISALRKALGEHKNEHRYLVTLPGKGYKFVADIRNGASELVFEKHSFSQLVVAHETEVEAPQPNASPSRVLNPAVTLIAIVAGLVGVAAGAWYLSSSAESAPAAAAINAPEPKLKRLTNNGRVNRLELSPDANFLAYTVRERGSYATELRIGQTDGGSDVLLRTDPEHSQYTISFSTDGQWLYFVEIPAVSEYDHPNGALYKIPVLRGVPQKLNDSASVFSVISPDEKQIAYPRRNSEHNTSTIVIANMDGSNAREVVSVPTERFVELESLSWSADGQRIVFGAATGTRKNDASNRTYEIFVVNLADGVIEQLTALDWNRVISLEWLKDGSGIIAVGRSSEQVNASSLWLVDYPGGKTQRLSRDVNRYAWASVAADSRSLAAVQSEAETNLWIAPADDLTDQTQITFSSSGRQDGWNGVDWTPDGRLVYIAWMDESSTVWIMNSDGSNATQLTSVGFRDERPEVTPDGASIVFESNRSGSREIWKMDLDGSNLERMTTGGASSPSVTADGWLIYRNEGAGSSLWRVPIAGGEPIRVSEKAVVIPRVSPDGKLIACGAESGGETKLVVYAIEGGDPLKVFDVPTTRNFRYSLKWSADGRTVYYPDSVNGVWQQSIDGGAATRVEKLPAERIFSFAWTPDGKQMVFGRQREERDVVLISNFK